MAARLRRLYPLFLVGILIGIGKVMLLIAARQREATAVDLAASIIANIVMLPSPGYFLTPRPLQGLFPINGPAWSMFWEMAINLVFARTLYRLRSGTLFAVATAAFAMLVVAVFHYGSSNTGWEWPSFWGGVPKVTAAFIAGIVLSRATARLRDGSRRKRPAALVVPLLLVACLSVPATGIGRIVYDLVFVAALAPCILLIGVRIELPGQLTRIAEWLGYASYPVYILHRGILDVYVPLCRHMRVPNSLALILFVPLVLIVAVFTARSIDAISARMRHRHAMSSKRTSSDAGIRRPTAPTETRR